jgi:hypothetical protein
VAAAVFHDLQRQLAWRIAAQKAASISISCFFVNSTIPSAAVVRVPERSIRRSRPALETLSGSPAPSGAQARNDENGLDTPPFAVFSGQDTAKANPHYCLGTAPTEEVAETPAPLSEQEDAGELLKLMPTPCALPDEHGRLFRMDAPRGTRSEFLSKPTYGLLQSPVECRWRYVLGVAASQERRHARTHRRNYFRCAV